MYFGASFVFLFFMVSTIKTDSPFSTDEQAVLSGNALFGKTLCKILSEKPGNLFYSPINTHLILSLVYQGAEGTTAEALSKVLEFSSPQQAANGYKQVSTFLNNLDNVTLTNANKVYVHQNAKILEPFRVAVVKNFWAAIEPINFAQNVAAAKSINSWVEKRTNDKIKDLIQPSDLDKETRLVLINGIYFKGNWAQKFSQNNTRIEPFFISDTEVVEVQMMNTFANFKFKYDTDLDARVVEIPYANEEISMVLFLPNRGDGIDDLERKLQNRTFESLFEDLHLHSLNLVLPKFKIENTIDMRETLEKLGLGELFDENNAKLRGIIQLDNDENLYVSKMVHKAFIEVNEEGSEAAAATDVIAVHTTSFEIPIMVHANHPFIFMIKSLRKNDKLSTPIFGGRISNPSTWT